MATYAPLQFLRTDWNHDVWTAIDNEYDSRTMYALYHGDVATVPMDRDKFQVGCVLIHNKEKQIYLNQGTDIIPDWKPFGPGNSGLPIPFEAGKVLTNDGVDAFWSLVDLETQVTGLLDVINIDVTSLVNDPTFITELSNNEEFITNLTENSEFQTLVNNFVVGGGGGSFGKIAQKPIGDDSTYHSIIGDIDGVNKVFQVDTEKYISGQIKVFLNGLLLNQGTNTDWFELDPDDGTIEFIEAPIETDIITIDFNDIAGSGGGEGTVKATITDTTPKPLDDKIEFTSSDNSVEITKTIQNPGGDEKILYDLKSLGGGFGGGGTLLAQDTTDFNTVGDNVWEDAYIFNIPANTITDEGVIKGTIKLVQSITGNGRVRFSFGGEESLEVDYTDGAGGAIRHNIVEFYIVANNADNSQKYAIYPPSESETEIRQGLLTVDSTQEQELIIQLNNINGLETVGVEWCVLEKITSEGSGSGDGFGGNGSDGKLEVLSGAHTIDLDFEETVTKNYTEIFIDSSAILDFINSNDNGTVVILKSQGNVTISGSIDLKKHGAKGGIGDTVNTSENGKNPRGLFGYSYGLGGNNNGQNNLGGGQYQNAIMFASNKYSVEAGTIYLVPGAGGGAGSSKGNASLNGKGGNGGDGGGALYIECAGNLIFDGIIDVSGEDGKDGEDISGDNTVTGGGGGGGSCGMCLIVYKQQTDISGTIESSGGDGGNSGIKSSGSSGNTTDLRGASGAGSVYGSGGDGDTGSSVGNGNIGAGGGGARGDGTSGSPNLGGTGGASAGGVIIDYKNILKI